MFSGSCRALPEVPRCPKCCQLGLTWESPRPPSSRQGSGRSPSSEGGVGDEGGGMRRRWRKRGEARVAGRSQLLKGGGTDRWISLLFSRSSGEGIDVINQIQEDFFFPRKRLLRGAPAALHRSSQPEGRNKRRADGPSLRLQPSPALLASFPRCRVLLSSKLSLMCAGLWQLFRFHCLSAPPASQVICSRREVRVALLWTAAGAPSGNKQGLKLERS